jgi:hypothetical protein
VAAGTHRDLEVVTTGERDGRGHVSRVGDPHDQGGTPLERGVPDSGGFGEALVAGLEDAAPERRSERVGVGGGVRKVHGDGGVHRGEAPS